MTEVLLAEIDILKKRCEKYEQAIEDIKSEILSLKGTFPSEYYVKIIDKHIRKEQE